jgi:hypothetical protein
MVQHGEFAVTASGTLAYQDGVASSNSSPLLLLVRAKDQSGNPVMTVINPDSFTEVTALPSTRNSTATSAGPNASEH